MKKILAFIMAAVLMLSMVALTGCGKDNTNVYADLDEFDSYVSADSTIIGEWIETSNTSSADEVSWVFMESTTLHIREVHGANSFTDVSAFNYNDETGELSYYVFNENKAFECKAEISGAKMTLTYDSGEVKTLEKKAN